MSPPKGFYRFEVKFHSLRSPLSPQAAAAYRAAGKTVSKTNRTTNPVRSMAYRSGTAITERKGELHNFTFRDRVVERSGIIAPKHAPSWVYDRQALWEAVWAARKRVDERWNQEGIASLPYGLNADQRWALAVKGANEIFLREGMIVDFSNHLYGARVEPKDEDFQEKLAEWKAAKIPFLEVDQALPNDEQHVMVERDKVGRLLGYRLRQPHTHFSAPTRAITPQGFAGHPEQWYRRSRLRVWRKTREDLENEALEAAGRPERVDCRTLKAQGIDRKPQKPHGLAKRLKNPDERMQERLEQSADIHDYNFGLSLAASVARVVTAALTRGAGAAILTGMEELGLMPGIGQTIGSIPMAVVHNVERALGARR
jgi:hypothetical protein